MKTHNLLHGGMHGQAAVDWENIQAGLKAKRRLKEFYNETLIKFGNYKREQAKIPEKVHGIKRNITYLENNINGINREISKVRIAGADSSNYYEGLNKIITLIDKLEKLNKEIEELGQGEVYVTSMSKKFKGTIGTRGRSRSRSRSRGGAKKKNKTSKKQPKIPKDFCKKSLNFPNVKNMRDNARKVVCFNPLTKKSCEEKFNKTFEETYLKKCEEKMEKMKN